MAAPQAAQAAAPQDPSQSSTSPAELERAFEHSIWYLLSLWPALHVAISSGWGGPESADKKDWFAGAVADLFSTNPDTDQEDLECFLLQIMQDEFDCYVEDETENQVAQDILAVRTRLLEERTLDAAKDVETRWRRRGQMKGSVEAATVNQDVDGDGDDDDDDDDMDMEEAPSLVPTITPTIREKVEPEIDEDGFTRVVGKKKR